MEAYNRWLGAFGNDYIGFESYLNLVLNHNQRRMSPHIHAGEKRLFGME
jgi:hypothetical protein